MKYKPIQQGAETMMNAPGVKRIKQVKSGSKRVLNPSKNAKANFKVIKTASDKINARATQNPSGRRAKGGD